MFNGARITKRVKRQIGFVLQVRVWRSVCCSALCPRQQTGRQQLAWGGGAAALAAAAVLPNPTTACTSLGQQAQRLQCCPVLPPHLPATCPINGAG